MWGLFKKPTCPIGVEMQDWVDGRFRWLQDQFGIDVPYKQPVVLPTPEFFPDSYDGTLDSVRTMVKRVAGYMRVDASGLDVFLFNQSEPEKVEGIGNPLFPGAAGLYEMISNKCAGGITAASQHRRFRNQAA
jgi:hypothetical protein